MPEWMSEIVQLGSTVVVVALFLWYQDRSHTAWMNQIKRIADDCHQNSAAGHDVMRSLDHSLAENAVALAGLRQLVTERLPSRIKVE